MTGRVQDCEVLLFSFEVGATHFHRLALVALLEVGVESPRQVPDERTKTQLNKSTLYGMSWKMLTKSLGSFPSPRAGTSLACACRRRPLNT